MRDMDVGMLPVGDGVKLKGMVTDRDIVVRGIAEGLDPRTAGVSEIMTPEVLYAFEDQDVDFAVKTVKDKQVRRLIIVNRDKDLTGIVSLGDLATRDDEEHMKAEALAGVSEKR